MTPRRRGDTGKSAATNVWARTRSRWLGCKPLIGSHRLMKRACEQPAKLSTIERNCPLPKRRRAWFEDQLDLDPVTLVFIDGERDLWLSNGPMRQLLQSRRR